MKTQTTAIEERHFRLDPEGKRKFVLHDWPPADIADTATPCKVAGITEAGSSDTKPTRSCGGIDR